MQLLKQCSKCGEVIEQGNGAMCEGCSDRSKARHTIYDKIRRNKESANVYQSMRWRDVRHKVKARDMYMCLVCFNMPKVKSMHTVHHIIPVDEDTNMEFVYSPDNLISVCRSCHQQIHATYDRNYVEKVKLQKELREMIVKGVGRG
ncbi:hypothetical protein AKG34_13410 [Peribacillus butanolivorans]|uniref:HNH endonuclease n=1 Tax=Peribacillus butanolivorans TaxID=421767 RepID=UPI0006A7520F|nr:hypothetical protein AKG34_13410 [Peribacillus butanolivorans]